MERNLSCPAVSHIWSCQQINKKVLLTNHNISAKDRRHHLDFQTVDIDSLDHEIHSDRRSLAGREQTLNGERAPGGAENKKG